MEVMSPSTGLTDAIESIVVGAVGLTSRALAEAAPDIELTIPQWRALVIVGDGDPGVRVGRVAERIGTSSPATSRLLRRLSQRGLLTLSPDVHDRRATLARLTPAGDRTRRAIVGYRQQALRSLADGLADDELAELERAARTIAGALARFT